MILFLVSLLKAAHSSLSLALELIQPFTEPFQTTGKAAGGLFPNYFSAFSEMNQLSEESNDGSPRAGHDSCTVSFDGNRDSTHFLSCPTTHTIAAGICAFLSLSGIRIKLLLHLLQLN